MNGTLGRLRSVAGLLIVVALLAAVVRVGPGAAQDSATPAAEGPANPEQAASPEATPALPTIPPETTDYAADWPVPQGNLASTRAALDSSIDSQTVADLDVAWTFEIPVSGFFGAVTANPIVVGDTVYIQDMQSNIYALDRASGSLKWQAGFNVGSIGPNGVTVNADTGEVLWKTPVGKHQNDDLTELPTDGYVEVYPGTYGGVESPIAFANGTVFVTYLDLPQYQGATGAAPNNMADFSTATGGILAINAADGTVVWENQLPTLVVGGATVANDLVFTAGLDGFVRAYDVATGTEVWNAETPLGINAPPAIAGDMLFVPAGFVKLPPAGSAAAATPADAAAEPPTAQLIAYRIGGAGEGATPETVAPPTEAAAPTESAAPTEAAAPSGTVVEVDMVDIAFTQKELTIPANTDVTLHIVNNGASLHNFKIDNPEVFSGDVQPGASTDLVVNLPPGTYQYYCTIPGHRQAGMVGTLTVQ